MCNEYIGQVPQHTEIYMCLFMYGHSRYRIAFHKFRGFVAIRESEIWGVVSFGMQRRAIHKSFLRENRIFRQFVKVSSLYARYITLHIY